MLSAGQPIRPEALWLPATYTVAVPLLREGDRTNAPAVSGSTP